MPQASKQLREQSWLARLDQRLAAAVEPATRDGNLTDEIAILRAEVLEVLAEPDPATRAQALARLVNSIRQLVLAQRLIQGDASDDVATAIANILGELGLGQ